MVQMRPTNLLFSQDSILSTLTEGEDIHMLIDKVARDGTYPNRWVPLNVARDRYDGKLYCQDNRRLYIFRVLECMGVISTVEVNIIPGSGRPKPSHVGEAIRFRDRNIVPRRYR